jgi:hypothetical protein
VATGAENDGKSFSEGSNPSRSTSPSSGCVEIRDARHPERSYTSEGARCAALI